MLINEKFCLEVGDWVKGKTGDDELLCGYVEGINSLQDIVKVRVVACDNEATVGKTIQLLSKWIEKLPVSIINQEEHIVSLIDLALDTRDERWFLQLSRRLQAIRKQQKDSTKQQLSRAG